MNKLKKTIKEIEAILQTLTECGISSEENYPVQHSTQDEHHITTPNYKSLSIALKNLSYLDIYTSLSAEKCYSARMLDGGLFSFRYIFINNRIVKHHLSYLPSPTLEQYQNDPVMYQEEMIYSEIIAKNVMPCPIRIDFDSSSTSYQEHDHSYTHLTIGEYKNCRIPVAAPLTPWTFARFILRNFYNTIFKEYESQFSPSEFKYPKTITNNEQADTHIFVGHTET